MVNKKSILVLCREVPPFGGGAGNVAMHLSNELYHKGYDIHYLTMYHPSLDSAEYEFNLHTVNCLRKNIDSSRVVEIFLYLIFGLFYAIKLNFKYNYQAIHSHSIVPEGIIGTIVSKLFSIKNHVITSHGSDAPGYNQYKYGFIHKLISPFWKYLVKNSKVITVPSDLQRKLICDLVPNANVSIIPNGINKFSIDNRKKNPRSVLIASRLVERKRFDLVLKAIAFIDEPLELNIIGDGPELLNLKELAANCEQHSVNFFGWVDNRSEQWIDLYSRCSVFVFPSEKESFGIAVLEAACAEMIVVSSRLQPVEDIMDTGCIYLDELSVVSVRKNMVNALDLIKEKDNKALFDCKDKASILFDEYSWSGIAALFEKHLKLKNEMK